MVVDRCAVADVKEDNQESTEDRRACEISRATPNENMFLNVHTPLQLGGRHLPKGPKARAPAHPQKVNDVGFKGCIKNLMHNGQVWNFFSSQFGFYLIYKC